MIMMSFRLGSTCILLLFCFIFSTVSGQVVTGRIINQQNEPVPYATVFVQELQAGTITNSEGNFSIQLARGYYHFTIRSLGYLQVEKQVQLNSDSLHLEIIMQRQEFEIKEVKVFPGKEDPAYYIVRKAMAKAAYYREKIKHYEADLYIKSNFTFTNIPKFYQNKIEIEGKKMKDVLQEDRTYVIESHNKITYDYPSKYKQEVISKRSSLVGFEEPPVMELITSNFYEERPNQSISPLSPQALKHYNYRYEGFITSGNSDIFKIKVEPKRKSDELVSGYMYIVDKLWCLYNIDFQSGIEFFNYSIKQQYDNLGNENWLPVSHLIDGDFSILGLKGEFYYGASLKYKNIEENYLAGNLQSDSVQNTIHELSEKEIALRNQVAHINAKEELTNSDVRKAGRLNRKILKEQYKDSTIVPKSNSYKVEEVDSLISKRENWDSVRTIPLTPAEIRSYQFTDSLRTHSDSAVDSVSNETEKKKAGWKKIITGNNDFCPDTMISFGYDGLVNPGNFGFNVVDGYKYKQQFHFWAKLASAKTISINPGIGYAFNRKALFWSVESRLDLLKNNDIKIDFGKISRDFKPDDLGISPTRNAISSWFFAQNYMKLYETSFLRINTLQQLNRNWKIAAEVEYNHFFPLENHTTYVLSDKKDYSPNIPKGLTKDSRALMQQLSFVYGISANYLKYQRKPWIEKSGFLSVSDFYSIRLSYNQGVPGLLSSVSDFSQLELSFNQEANLSPGTGIIWQINTGVFFKAEQLHFSQYKHFRTAEIPVSFKSFSHTFQLLNDYLPSTSENYLTIGGEFRTEYLLLRYLSFINRRTWSEGLHLNYLTTPSLRNYWESGYSLNNIFFAGNLGVFAGFSGKKFQSIEIKISIAGL